VAVTAYFLTSWALRRNDGETMSGMTLKTILRVEAREKPADADHPRCADLGISRLEGGRAGRSIWRSSPVSSGSFGTLVLGL
jgi:hypothetical protein